MRRSIGRERPRPSLTHDERELLTQEFNLTDGHALRPWSDAERAIIQRAPEMMLEFDRERQPEVEQAYISALLSLHGQSYLPTRQRHLICLTASEALEIVANHLRLDRRKLAFVEPCFDNLANIWKRHAIPLLPLPERLLESPELLAWLKNARATAICVVSPNNPTGTLLTQSNLEALVAYASRRRAILVLDSSFRAYVPPSTRYDQYRLLADAGCDYIIVEDTGKTWPTLELKASVMTVSPGLFESIYAIYTDFLLHVSPFVLRLLREFVELSIRDDCKLVRGLVATNRSILRASLEGSAVRSLEKEHSSVAWLHLPTITGGEFVGRLAAEQVHALAGDRFHWAQPPAGANYVRVALCRDPGRFRIAAERIGRIAERWIPQTRGQNPGQPLQH